MSRLRGAVPIVIGGGILSSVAILYLRPEMVLTAIPDLEAIIREVEPVVLLVAATAMLGIAAIVLVLRAKLFGSSGTVENTTSRTESSQSLFSGAGTTRGQLGARFDTHFQTATDYGSAARTDRETARTQTVDELHELAQTVYQQAAGCDSETAQAAIETGEWTTNRRARGLLAAESGPSIPLRLWAWDLIVGRDPYANSIDHTLTALEAISETGLQEEHA